MKQTLPHSWPILAAFLAAAAAAYLLFGLDATASGLLLATAPAGVDIKQLLDNIRTGVTDFKANMSDELKALRADIERVELKSGRAGLVGLSSSGDSTQPRAQRATPAERKAFDQFLRTGDKAYALEAKAVTVSVPGEGGLAVPMWFDSEVHSMMVDTYPLLSIVRRRSVRNFPSRHIVTDRNMGSGFVQETAARPATNTPGVIAVDPPHGEWYANPQLTQWAIDDISFDAVAWIQREVARELGQSQQSSIIAGNGTHQPKGFLDGPISTTADSAGTRPHGTLQYFPTGVSGALPDTTSDTINLLLDVVHGTHQFYRSRATWLMSAPTLNVLRRMKDADGRPLLLDSLINRQPSTLLGYPVFEVEDMPPPAANSLSIAFGDFDSGYILDEHEKGLRVVPDPYSNKPYVGFYSTMRFGGAVLDSDAIKLVRFSTT